MVLFTAFLSIIAAVGMTVLGAPTLPTNESVESVDAVRSGVQTTLWIVAVIIPTIGHWLGVLLYNLFHRSEVPLFQNGGWSPAGLALSGWPLTIVVAALYAGVLLVAGV